MPRSRSPFVDSLHASSAAEILHRSRLWSVLAPGELEAFAAHATLVSSAPQEYLFGPTEGPPGMFVVRRGRYKVSLGSRKGREQILAIARPGRLLVEGLATPSLTCIALGPASAWKWSYEQVQQSMRGSAALASCVANTLAARLGGALDWIHDLASCSVEQRLANFLLSQAERVVGSATESIVVRRSLAVKEVAALLGTTREEITRAQSKLHKRGLIRVFRERIRIVDLNGLRALSEARD